MTPSGIPLTELLYLALKTVALRAQKEGQPTRDVWLWQTPERLHPFMRTVAERHKASFPALAELTFSDEGSFHHSPELADAFSTLQRTGVISRINPNFDQFTPPVLDDTAEIVGQETKRAFAGNDDALASFQALVDDLQRLVVETDAVAAK